MSPVAASGSATVVDSGGPGLHGFAFGGGKGGKRVLPHIDDIINVTAGVDINTPIEKVLSAAENAMRSAESSKSFNRPDLALKDYLRSYQIAAEVIPRHPDYVSFQADRKPLGDRFSALIKKINAQHASFERIKQDIKADNARTGVQPTVSRPASNQTQTSWPGSASSRASHGSLQGQNGVAHGNSQAKGHALEEDRRDGAASGHARSLSQQQPLTGSPRAKPAVQPKPQALHGNAIRPGGSQGTVAKNRTGEDLLARFANLRAAPNQDPRIRTEPPASKPMGPREMPQKPGRPLPGTLPDMPKMPDAIYSPARGTVSNEAAELPSSTPRGMFSRTNSTASFTSSSAASAVKSQPHDDYFTPSHTFNPPSSLPPKRVQATIPEGDTIKAEVLVKLQQAGSRDVHVLLIDVRSREDFDEGHIMSPSTICIEPEILQRSNISASEIADSMILSPQHERLLFEGRHGFDLIVFYDQESTRVDQTTPGGSTDPAILNLSNALKYYDFYGDSQNKPPKLLEGGIVAWANLMGSSSLQSSNTLAGLPKTQKPMRGRTSSMHVRPIPKHATRPIQDVEEARRWEETLPAITAEYHRSKDDFLRRFPDITPEKESMTSPMAPAWPEYPEHQASYFTPPRSDLSTTLTSPPTRPAPTVPRPSFSGLRDSDDRDQYIRAKMARTGQEIVRKRAVGLHNPHNWCYANSSIQALFGSSGFSEELFTGNWQNSYKAPKKGDEKILPPQLMTKIVANLFHWMQNGNFSTMQAKTLMDYLYHISQKERDGRRKPEDEIFGGRSQQDAQEFLSFLITELDDETNTLRDRTSNAVQPVMNSGKTALQGALEYWAAHSKSHASIIDKYWRAMEVMATSCNNCGHSLKKFDVSDFIGLTLPPDARGMSLNYLLDDYTAAESLAEYKCDGCGAEGTNTKRISFARLPDLLCILFRRFTHAGAQSEKDNRTVTFPVRDLDMSKYFLIGQTQAGGPYPAGELDPHFEGPFIYDAYAVVIHGGTLRSGHYQAYVRDEGASDPTLWNHFNDTVVRPVRVGTAANDPGLKEIYSNGASTAYMVFYKRRDSRR